MVPLIGFAEESGYFVLSDPASGYAHFVPALKEPQLINSSHVPNYGRIDLRFSYDTQIGNNPLTLYADFINVFNKRNVLEYQIIIRPEGNLAEDIPPSLRWGRPVIYYRPTYMLLFVPSVGLRMSF